MTDTRDSEILGAEARRLLEFRRQHVRKNDMTACPQCATLVKIQAVKCPQCTSDISLHTEMVREELGKLERVTAALGDLHRRERELFRAEAGEKPILQRLREFFSQPDFLQDLKIVLPFLVLLFALVLFLRNRASGLIFLAGTAAAGFSVYFLFAKWNLRKFVTVDLYRAALLGGLLVILSSARVDSARFWPAIPGFRSGTVTVRSATANIREAPTTASSVVTSARSGDRLTVMEKDGSWYRVRTADGRVGWVNLDLVD